MNRGGCAGSVGHFACDRNRRVDDENEEAERDQGEHAEHDALRHVPLWVCRLFRRKRKLLDGQEQPHRKRQRRQDAVCAEGQEGTMPVRQLDCRSGRRIGADIHRVLAEVEDRECAHKKDDEDGDCKQGDDDGDSERQLDPTSVEPDKDDIAENPPDRLEGRWCLKNCRQVGADKEDDDRRRQHIFDVLGNSGDEAAPRSEGGAGEGIGAAGMRQGRAHLGDGIGEAEIHDCDDDGADEHAAPAAHGEAQVPARKSPEITAPTPSAHKEKTPAWRRSARLSK